MEMPFIETVVAYVLRTLEEIDDTFGVVEYLELHFRADRLQYELSAPERSVRVLLAVQPDLSLDQEEYHVLHASCLRDHIPFRIKTILEYIPLVETTRGTIGIFGAAMVG